MSRERPGGLDRRCRGEVLRGANASLGVEAGSGCNCAKCANPDPAELAADLLRACRSGGDVCGSGQFLPSCPGLRALVDPTVSIVHVHLSGKRRRSTCGRGIAYPGCHTARKRSLSLARLVPNHTMRFANLGIQSCTHYDWPIPCLSSESQSAQCPARRAAYGFLHSPRLGLAGLPFVSTLATSRQASRSTRSVDVPDLPYLQLRIVALGSLGGD